MERSGAARRGAPCHAPHDPASTCFCSFMTFFNWSSVLKSCLQLQIGQCNWLPQKTGNTGTNQNEMNSLLLTGFTW